MPTTRANVKPNTLKALTPLAYNIDAIVLTNHAGKTADIQNIITDFSITESLYTSSLIFKANIKDVANFIEEYELNGQETIDVKIGRQDYASAEILSVDLKFFVTEYPLYGRADKQQSTQVYAIVGVSRHAYLSKLLRISRAVQNVTSEEIRSILANDLNASKIGTWDAASSRFHGVIPYMNPLDAASWLLRRTYDTAKSAPFFLHETLRDGIQLRSYARLLDPAINPIHRTYFDHKIFNTVAGTEADFKQRQERIYSISSEFKLSKILPAMGGAYGSTGLFMDLSTKKLSTEVYNYSDAFDDTVTLNGYSLLSDKFMLPLKNADKRNGNASGTISDIQSPSSKGFQDMHNAKRGHVPTNKYAFSSDGSVSNYHGLSPANLSYLDAFNENMDAFVHDLTIAGDFTLSAGKRVVLKIPKAIDFGAYDKTASKSDDDIYDRVLSGTYIVTSIIHTFGAEYYCKLRVKRDSLSYDINK